MPTQFIGHDQIAQSAATFIYSTDTLTSSSHKSKYSIYRRASYIATDIATELAIEIEMESEVKRWLKKRYRSASSEGPDAKKMKFRDLHDDLTTQFSSASLNFNMVSQEIKSAFPNTFSKAVGKGCLKVFG